MTTVRDIDSARVTELFDELFVKFTTDTQRSEHNRSILDDWHATTMEVLETGTREYTFAHWMTHHNGQRVETFQIDTNRVAAWVPGARTVDCWASHVRLDESRRDYAGAKVIARTDDVLVITTDQHVIIYRTVV